MPSSNATSNSAGLIDTDLRNPWTSVNHSRTKRIPRSSTVRSTYSACLVMTSWSEAGNIMPSPNSLTAQMRAGERGIRESGVGVWSSARATTALGQPTAPQALALVRGETTPDAIALVRLEGVEQAVVTHLATAADLLGLLDL